jgi:hypothetical protein
MSENEKLAAFRAAVLNEQNAQTLMDRLYSEFIVKMLRYQTGKGEVPTQKEFDDWRLAVDSRIELAKQRGLL